jgi:hypothetical protein
MAKASDNQFPSVLFTEGAVPANPAAGDQRIYIDTADKKLKRVNSAGTVVNIEATGSGVYLPLAGGTMAGEIVAADNLVTRPEIKDYAETVNPIGGTGGGTQDIDLTAGNVVSATVDTSANTFTFSNPSASGKACSFTLILTNGGSQTVNWPGAVKWAGATEPTLTAAGVDILTFVTVDAGTTWYGFCAGLDMS